MPYSYETTTTDGSTNLVTVPFSYLAQEHVSVTIDGDLISPADYSWVSAGVIALDTTPLTGLERTVRRTTPLDDLSVVFSAGNLTSSNLNIGNLQALYILQELEDYRADLTARALRVPAGETVGELPAYADMVGKLLMFDSLRRPVGYLPDSVSLGIPSPDSVGTVELEIDAVEAENMKSYQILARHFNPAENRIPQTATVNLYVSATGNDTTGVGSLAQPYQTVARAWLDLAYKMDGRGNTATIWLVGLNQKPAVMVGPANTFSRVYVQGYGVTLGTPATWANVAFDPALGSQSVIASLGAQIECKGFKVTSTAGHGLVAWQQGSVIEYSSIEFGSVETANGCQVWATQGGQIEPLGDNVIKGGGGCHVAATHAGRYRLTNNAGGGIVRIQYAGANVTFALATAYCLNGEIVLTSVAPVGSAFNPSGFTITGKQYLIDGKVAAIQSYGQQVPAPGDFFGSLPGEFKVQDAYGPKMLGSKILAALNGTTPLHDYNPGVGGAFHVEKSLVQLRASGNTVLTGLFSAGYRDGQCITLMNTLAPTWTLKHYDTGSVLSSRFGLPGGSDVVLTQYDSITLMFDTAIGYWLAVSHTK